MVYQSSTLDAQRQREQRAVKRDLRIPAIAEETEWKPVGSVERKASFSRDPFSFLSGYFPLTFSGTFTRQRREMVEVLTAAASGGFDQAVAAPRGTGKTSIIEGVVVYCLLTGRLKFPLIVGATVEHANMILGNIKREFETNPLLYADWPEVCHPVWALEGATIRAHTQTVDGERTRIKWSGNYLVFPHVPQRYESLCCGSVLMTRSLEGAIRGIRHGAKRPDLVIIDDPETPESAVSEIQREKRERCIEKDLAGLGGPGTKLSRVMLTTIMHYQSLSAKYTEPQQKPSWNGRRMRLIDEWPERTDLWDEYMILRQECQQQGDQTAGKATDFYCEHRAAMDAGVVVTDPERYIDDLELSAVQHAYNLICDKGKDAFATEYQNDPPVEDQPQELGLTPVAVQSRVNGLAHGEVPTETVHLTAGIDVGKYRLHYVVTAWRNNAVGFVVDYGVHDVFPDNRDDKTACEQAIRQALHDWRSSRIEQPYRDADGGEHQISLALIDAAQFSSAVYRFVKDIGQRGYRAAHGVGDSGDKRPKLEMHTGAANKQVGDHWTFYLQQSGIWLCMTDTDYWKSWVHERFVTEPGKPGSLCLYGTDRRIHTSYGHHLCAEKEIEEFVRGKGLKRRWVTLSRNNHWLDATYMACVASSIAGVRLMKPTVREQKKQRRLPGPPQHLLTRPGGWVKGMR